jgi:hypothetical protein
MKKIMWTLLFCLLCIFQCLPSLELKRVILSTNNNPNYIQFWPVVAPVWLAMGLRPTLALIANENCTVDESLGDVIRFDPIPGVPESLQAQVVRLLLPTLFPEDGCIISDIDMIPISRSYYFNGASKSPPDAFLIYRDKAYGASIPAYPMCYFAAEGQVFSSVFGITEKEQFQDVIVHWASLGYGWNTDEYVLYLYLKSWEEAGNQIVRLGQGVGPRLDRSNWIVDDKNIGKYIDCHCPRPYSKYKSSIDKVVKAIFELLSNENP